MDNHVELKKEEQKGLMEQADLFAQETRQSMLDDVLQLNVQSEQNGEMLDTLIRRDEWEDNQSMRNSVMEKLPMASAKMSAPGGANQYITVPKKSSQQKKQDEKDRKKAKAVNALANEYTYRMQGSCEKFDQNHVYGDKRQTIAEEYAELAEDLQDKNKAVTPGTAYALTNSVKNVLEFQPTEDMLSEEYLSEHIGELREIYARYRLALEGAKRYKDLPKDKEPSAEDILDMQLQAEIEFEVPDSKKEAVEAEKAKRGSNIPLELKAVQVASLERAKTFFIALESVCKLMQFDLSKGTIIQSKERDLEKQEEQRNTFDKDRKAYQESAKSTDNAFLTYLKTQMRDDKNEKAADDLDGKLAELEEKKSFSQRREAYTQMYADFRQSEYLRKDLARMKDACSALKNGRRLAVGRRENVPEYIKRMAGDYSTKLSKRTKQTDILYRERKELLTKALDKADREDQGLSSYAQNGELTTISKDDSVEMVEVKQCFIAISQYIDSHKNEKMTPELTKELRAKYLAAISSCDYYTKHRNPYTKRGQLRKRMVEDARLGLDTEFNKMPLIQNSLSKLTLAEYLGLPVEAEAEKQKAPQAEAQVEAQQKQPEQPEQPEAEQEKKKKPKVPKWELERKEREDAQTRATREFLTMSGDIRTQLKAGSRKLIESYVSLREVLRTVPESKPWAQTFDMNGTKIRLLQKENNTLYIVQGGELIPMQHNVRLLLRGIEEHMVKNAATYGVEKVQALVQSVSRGLVASNVQGGENVTLTRHVLEAFLTNQSGVPVENFGNLDLGFILEMSRKYADTMGEPEKIAKQRVKELNDALKQEIRTAESKVKEKVNNEATLLIMKQKEMQKDGEQKPKVVHKDKQEVKEKWTPDEKKIINMLADLIYSTDTWHSDELRDSAGVRTKEKIIEHAEAFELLMKSYEESTEKPLSEEAKKQKQVDAEAEIKKIIEEEKNEPKIIMALAKKRMDELDGERRTLEEKEAALEAERSKKEKECAAPISKARELLEQAIKRLEDAKKNAPQDVEAEEAAVEAAKQELAIASQPINALQADIHSYREKIADIREKIYPINPARLDEIQNSIADAQKKLKENTVTEEEREKSKADVDAYNKKNWFEKALATKPEIITKDDNYKAAEQELKELQTKLKKFNDKVMQDSGRTKEITDKINLRVTEEIESGKKPAEKDIKDTTWGRLLSRMPLGGENDLESFPEALLNLPFIKAAYDQYINDQQNGVENAPSFAENLKKQLGEKGVPFSVTLFNMKLMDIVKQQMTTVQEAINKSVFKEEKEENKGQEGQEAQEAQEQDKKKQAPEKGSSEYLQWLLDQIADSDSGEAAFQKAALKRYFKESAQFDQQSMFASGLRNMVPCTPAEGEQMTEAEKEAAKKKAETDFMCSFFAGILKGAGPLMQKILQGMPTSGLPEEIQQAVEDMKSKLTPIPQEIVDAELAAMVDRSEKAVERIEVLRSLGAASVGQTFLCKMYGPSLSEEGQEVVIKLLRPDALTKMIREEEILMKCAEDIPGQADTLRGKIQKIREELNLGIEAENCYTGELYDKKSEHVKAMKISSLIRPTANAMVLEKAEGTDLSKYMQKVADNNSKVDEISELTTENVVEVKAKYQAMVDELERLDNTEKNLKDLADSWVEEGIFKSGFFHGDLHAGNIMVSEKDLTLIDFGNATQLTKQQRRIITSMMIAAFSSDVDAYLHGYHMLLLRGNEDDEKLEATYQEKREELKQTFADILSSGKESDAGERIAATLGKAQELGVALPQSVANFSSAQIRLQNAMSDLSKRREELVNKLQAMDKVMSKTLLVDGEIMHGDAGTAVLFFEATDKLKLLDEIKEGDEAALLAKLSSCTSDRELSALLEPLGNDYKNALESREKLENYLTGDTSFRLKQKKDIRLAISFNAVPNSLKKTASELKKMDKLDELQQLLDLEQEEMRKPSTQEEMDQDPQKKAQLERLKYLRHLDSMQDLRSLQELQKTILKKQADMKQIQDQYNVTEDADQQAHLQERFASAVHDRDEAVEEQERLIFAQPAFEALLKEEKAALEKQKKAFKAEEKQLLAEQKQERNELEQKIKSKRQQLKQDSENQELKQELEELQKNLNELKDLEFLCKNRSKLKTYEAAGKTLSEKQQKEYTRLKDMLTLEAKRSKAHFSMYKIIEKWEQLQSQGMLKVLDDVSADDWADANALVLQTMEREEPLLDLEQYEADAQLLPEEVNEDFLNKMETLHQKESAGTATKAESEELEQLESSVISNWKTKALSQASNYDDLPVVQKQLRISLNELQSKASEMDFYRSLNWESRHRQVGEQLELLERLKTVKTEIQQLNRIENRADEQQERLDQLLVDESAIMLQLDIMESIIAKKTHSTIKTPSAIRGKNIQEKLEKLDALKAGYNKAESDIQARKKAIEEEYKTAEKNVKNAPSIDQESLNALKAELTEAQAKVKKVEDAIQDRKDMEDLDNLAKDPNLAPSRLQWLSTRKLTLQFMADTEQRVKDAKTEGKSAEKDDLQAIEAYKLLLQDYFDGLAQEDKLSELQADVDQKQRQLDQMTDSNQVQLEKAKKAYDDMKDIENMQLLTQLEEMESALKNTNASLASAEANVKASLEVIAGMEQSEALSKEDQAGLEDFRKQYKEFQKEVNTQTILKQAISDKIAEIEKTLKSRSLLIDNEKLDALEAGMAQQLTDISGLEQSIEMDKEKYTITQEDIRALEAKAEEQRTDDEKAKLEQLHQSLKSMDDQKAKLESKRTEYKSMQTDYQTTLSDNDVAQEKLDALEQRTRSCNAIRHNISIIREEWRGKEIEYPSWKDKLQRYADMKTKHGDALQLQREQMQALQAKKTSGEGLTPQEETQLQHLTYRQTIRTQMLHMKQRWDSNYSSSSAKLFNEAIRPRKVAEWEQFDRMDKLADVKGKAMSPLRDKLSELKRWRAHRANPEALIEGSNPQELERFKEFDSVMEVRKKSQTLQARLDAVNSLIREENGASNAAFKGKAKDAQTLAKDKEVLQPCVEAYDELLKAQMDEESLFNVTIGAKKITQDFKALKAKLGNKLTANGEPKAGEILTADEQKLVSDYKQQRNAFAKNYWSHVRDHYEDIKRPIEDLYNVANCKAISFSMRLLEMPKEQAEAELERILKTSPEELQTAKTSLSAYYEELKNLSEKEKEKRKREQVLSFVQSIEKTTKDITKFGKNLTKKWQDRNQAHEAVTFFDVMSDVLSRNAKNVISNLGWYHGIKFAVFGRQ